jgi:transposase
MAPVINDPTAMNLFFVNLDGVRLIQIDDEAVVPEVHVELERELVGCPTCGVVTTVKDRHRVTLVDLTMAGRMVALVWNKRRFRCAERSCPTGTWTEVDERIAAIRGGGPGDGARRRVARNPRDPRRGLVPTSFREVTER